MTELSRGQFLQLLGGALGVGLLAACTPTEQKTNDDHGTGTAAPTRVSALPVEIHVADAPSAITIGIVASLTSPPGEGSEWVAGVSGARVATQRLAMGGTAVSLLVANDAGNAAAMSNAVDRLASQGAAGIVVATSGGHLDGGLESARKLGIPTLMPFARNADLARPGTWLTGPVDKDLDRALVTALASRHLVRPLLIDAGGGTPSGLEPAAKIALPADADAAAVAKLVAPQLSSKANRPDAVLVTGNAVRLAAAVAALQGAKVDLPVFLGPAAAAPGFSQALVSAKGSLAADLTTCGSDSGDDVAMRPGPDGGAMSSYLSAVRMTATDPKAKDIFSSRPFSDVAGDAAVLVHDAVVALVLGAAKAKSTAPKEIAAALGHVTAGATDGLAAGPLDFTRASSYDPARVVPLAASSQDLGLRPRNPDAVRVAWFKAPV